MSEVLQETQSEQAELLTEAMGLRTSDEPIAIFMRLADRLANLRLRENKFAVMGDDERWRAATTLLDFITAKGGDAR